jgi:hypothetical protein
VIVVIAPAAPALAQDTPLLGAPPDEADVPVLQPAVPRRGRPGFRPASQ